MTDLKPEDLARLREIAEKATPGPWENGGSSVTNWHDHTFEMEWIPNGQDDEGEAEGVNSNADADGAFIAAFNPQVALSLLADRARMEKAIELLCEVYEAARDVSMAAVQDDDGEWSIKGDPELMLGQLYLATEEIRKVTKGASSELRGRDVTVARRYTDDDYQEMRRNLYPTKGASQ